VEKRAIEGLNDQIRLTLGRKWNLNVRFEDRVHIQVEIAL